MAAKRKLQSVLDLLDDDDFDQKVEREEEGVPSPPDELDLIFAPPPPKRKQHANSSRTLTSRQQAQFITNSVTKALWTRIQNTQTRAVPIQGAVGILPTLVVSKWQNPDNALRVVADFEKYGQELSMAHFLPISEPLLLAVNRNARGEFTIHLTEGHHRLYASMLAGLEFVPVSVTKTNLPNNEAYFRPVKTHIPIEIGDYWRIRQLSDLELPWMKIVLEK